MNSSNFQAVVEEFTELAPNYDHRWSFYIERTLGETLRRIELRRDERILDVGCGTGALLKTLRTVTPTARLWGVDPSSAMLDEARTKLDSSVPLLQSDAHQLPFRDESFSLVISTNAFHYFTDPIEPLREMLRVSTKPGRVVITDWCDDYITCRLCDLILRVFNRAHFRAYGSHKCRRLLEEADYSGIRVERYKINWLWGLMTAVGSKRGHTEADAAAEGSTLCST